MTYTKEQAKQRIKELVALRGKRIENKGEEGKRGIIIPKDKFKEFVEVQKMLPVEKIEKLLYPFMHSNFRQALYLIYGVCDLRRNMG